ncbi:hypothetical protein EVAR_54433_1 [Eumeta japonica]|uniref:Uncharacterized protein n=1 Tax=Eumeta variegata TaxID=151549 RepID=A0A4C1YYX8_EUMVA|nr:hypothetical protein EVAR_54433_1 [Eumeta japonica]
MGRPTKRAAHRLHPYCKPLRSSIDHHIRLRQSLDHNDVTKGYPTSPTAQSRNIVSKTHWNGLRLASASGSIPGRRMNSLILSIDRVVIPMLNADAANFSYSVTQSRSCF